MHHGTNNRAIDDNGHRRSAEGESRKETGSNKEKEVKKWIRAERGGCAHGGNKRGIDQSGNGRSVESKSRKAMGIEQAEMSKRLASVGISGWETANRGADIRRFDTSA
jgi:hypothetical protein